MYAKRSFGVTREETSSNPTLCVPRIVWYLKKGRSDHLLCVAAAHWVKETWLFLIWGCFLFVVWLRRVFRKTRLLFYTFFGNFFFHSRPNPPDGSTVSPCVSLFDLLVKLCQGAHSKSTETGDFFRFQCDQTACFHSQHASRERRENGWMFNRREETTPLAVWTSPSVFTVFTVV